MQRSRKRRSETEIREIHNIPKKKKKKSSSRKVRESSESQSISEAEPTSTWDILLECWPLEERPEGMQNKSKVNKMSLQVAFTVKDHYEKQMKKEGRGDAIFGRDPKPTKKTFEEEDDDSAKKLHALRFERGPIVEPTSYWDKMPSRRKPTYRHLPLEFSGVSGAVNECVVVRAHDRTLPLTVRMFCKKNVNRKSFANADGRNPAKDWEASKTTVELLTSLKNLAEILHCLWPLDRSAQVLQSILLHYKLGESLVGSEKDKCRLKKLKSLLLTYKFKLIFKSSTSKVTSVLNVKSDHYVKLKHKLKKIKNMVHNLNQDAYLIRILVQHEHTLSQFYL